MIFWLLFSASVAAIVVTVSVLITASVIKGLMQKNEGVFQNSVSAMVMKKINERGHKIVKIGLKDKFGNTKTAEIRSDVGANVYEGQVICI